jgi:hypothetical protein
VVGFFLNQRGKGRAHSTLQGLASHLQPWAQAGVIPPVRSDPRVQLVLSGTKKGRKTVRQKLLLPSTFLRMAKKGSLVARAACVAVGSGARIESLLALTAPEVAQVQLDHIFWGAVKARPLGHFGLISPAGLAMLRIIVREGGGRETLFPWSYASALLLFKQLAAQNGQKELSGWHACRRLFVTSQVILGVPYPSLAPYLFHRANKHVGHYDLSAEMPPEEKKVLLSHPNHFRFLPDHVYPQALEVEEARDQRGIEDPLHTPTPPQAQGNRPRKRARGN